MINRISLVAIALAAASTAAVAQTGRTSSLSYTDVAPYTDLVAPTPRASVEVGRDWKGNMPSTAASAPAEEAPIAGVIPVAEQPYPVKDTPLAGVSGTPATSIMAGPPNDGLTFDGYRFVGGEAGYVYIGRRGATR